MDGKMESQIREQSSPTRQREERGCKRMRKVESNELSRPIGCWKRHRDTEIQRHMRRCAATEADHAYLLACLLAYL
jgi:hypothetical protein